MFYSAGRSRIRKFLIDIAECILLGCFCILLSSVLSICSTALLVHYTEVERQKFSIRFDGFFTTVGIMIFWSHVLLICSYKSILAQESTVIRFINDNTGENTIENDEARAVDTSRSTIPIWLSLIAMWLYTHALGLVLSLLFVYAGRVPDDISKPTFHILYIAGIFSYIYRVFDLRTNVMFVAFIGSLTMMTALMGRPESYQAVIVISLFSSILVESYNYHCCTPLEPSTAISVSYVPPVFISQTGTGSDLEVGGVRETPICGRPAVTYSNSTHDARGAYTIVKDGGDV